MWCFFVLTSRLAPMFPLSQNPSNSSSSRGNGRSSSSSHNPHNRNYGAAFFQMMTIALLCTSLAQPSWLSLTTRTNSASPRSGESCPKHLTLYQFFDYGYFETGDSRNSTTIVSPVRLYYHSAVGSKFIFFFIFSLGCLFKRLIFYCSNGLPHPSYC
jgi:hypothetical protein